MSVQGLGFREGILYHKHLVSQSVGLRPTKTCAANLNLKSTETRSLKAYALQDA